MKDIIKGIGCYLSCMLLFNIIYLLTVISQFSSTGFHEPSVYITFAVCVILALLGVIFSVLIMCFNDLEPNDDTIGKKLVLNSVIDRTAENYFSNYSLIVLTGVALPREGDYIALIIFILIEVSLGSVYIKKGLYYINPVLTLLDYSFYECECCPKNDVCNSGKYYFIVHGRQLKQGEIIRYKNISNRLIFMKYSDSLNTEER